MEIIIIQEGQLIFDSQHGVGGLSYQCLFRMMLSSNKLVSSLYSLAFDREERERVLSGKVIAWSCTFVCAVCLCGVVLKHGGIITFM
jgi:hypothetical protein